MSSGAAAGAADIVAETSYAELLATWTFAEDIPQGGTEEPTQATLCLGGSILSRMLPVLRRPGGLLIALPPSALGK